ncbi:MAG: dTDP-4-dehydrorhamnose 3,5-epimerase [Candidatus Neomarinimicrobiota bacterium]|jgi:dTDP-4-dehydrorhamnose 3,5-epimerase/CDP-3, 6-dideoxy-D-glycero-D-glycero-4-hexulose-5-epimerase
MKIIKTLFDSVQCIELPRFDDERGSFIKCYDDASFKNAGISSCFKESYFSISKKNVIRGMHFQLPPKDHEKLVCVTLGAVKDVILDIRRESPTYGEVRDVVLSAENHLALYIPRGFAHGFMSLEDHTIMNYLVATVHSPQHDMAIRWDTIHYNWNNDSPIMSNRDIKALPLSDFKSPF